MTDSARLEGKLGMQRVLAGWFDAIREIRRPARIEPTRSSRTGVVADQGRVTTMGGYAFAQLRFRGAFGTFLFRQFFLTIPEELGDAATVDGANHLDIFTRMYLPLSGPALTAYGIITALGAG